MDIQEHDGFVDVLCDVTGMNEIELETRIRNELPTQGYNLTDDPPGRVGNPGTGTIFRFKLMEE